jgi:molybdopterin synthase sulfur carrier subunit
MMNVKIKLFGIAREIVNASEFDLELAAPYTVEALRNEVMVKYPSFGDLRSVMIAVNSEYASNELKLVHSDEVALIPPVSGG